MEISFYRRCTAYMVALAMTAFVANRAVWGLTFWTEGFESYPTGTINGKDSTWTSYSYFGSAQVVAFPHAGSKALMVHAGAGMPGWTSLCTWKDDTPTAPHGGVVDFSWWMYPSSGVGWGNHWDISAVGMNGATIAHLGNVEAGLRDSIDCETSGGWVETKGTAAIDTWSKVFLQLDLESRPNRYRIRVGEAGAWQGWYTLGSSEQFFRRLDLVATIASEDIYFDDFSGAVPCTVPPAAPPRPHTGMVGCGWAYYWFDVNAVPADEEWFWQYGTCGTDAGNGVNNTTFGGTCMLRARRKSDPSCWGPCSPAVNDGLNNDLAVFLACVTGPAIPYDPQHLPIGCMLIPDLEGKIAVDFDRDGDADQVDFGLFQRCYSGSRKPADPNSAGEGQKENCP